MFHLNQFYTIWRIGLNFKYQMFHLKFFYTFDELRLGFRINLPVPPHLACAEAYSVKSTGFRGIWPIKFIRRLTKKDFKRWSWYKALNLISSIDLDIKHWSWNPKYKNFQLRVSTHLLSVLLNDLSAALIVTGQHTAKHHKIGTSTKRLKIPFYF